MRLQFISARSMADDVFRAGFFSLAIIAIGLSIAHPGIAQDKESAKTEEVEETEETDKDDSLKDRLSELENKLISEVEKLTEEYGDAETLDERKGVVQRRRELEKLIVEDAIGLARKFDDDADSIDALSSFLMMQVKGEARLTLLKELRKKHKTSQNIGGFVDAVSKIRTPSKELEDALRVIIKRNPSDEVKAETTFALIAYLDKLKEKSFSAKKDSYLGSRSDKEIDDQVTTLLEDCIEKYSDVKKGSRSYSELASKKLQIRNIKIGAIAPEIEGVDLDDVSFKLSEYRGKVVVIDFWGDW